MSDIVQVDYDGLERVAALIGRQSEQVAQIQENVRRAMNELLSDGWQGRGRQAFEAEMQGEVLPAVGRLQDTLGDAATVVRDASSRYRQGEEEAAAPFRGAGSGGGASGSGRGPLGSIGDSISRAAAEAAASGGGASGSGRGPLGNIGDSISRAAAEAGAGSGGGASRSGRGPLGSIGDSISRAAAEAGAGSGGGES